MPPVFLALCIIASCATIAASPTAHRSARDLPLLPTPANATLLGASYLGDTLPPASSPSRNASDVLYARLLAAGARLAQVELSWSTLEPAQGQYNFQGLVSLLSAARSRGTFTLFTLNAIDTDVVKVPADLADPADPSALAPGLRWNSSTVLARYAAAVAVAAPLAQFYGAFYFGVGNEVDGNLGLRPETADDYVAFVAAARDAAQAAASPDLAVGATVSLTGLLALSRAPVPPTWLAALLSVADATPLTYYPLSDGLVVVPPAQVAADVAGALALLPPDAPALLQEWGCPAGFNNASSVDGSSLAYQAAFVDQMAVCSAPVAAACEPPVFSC